MDLTLLGYGFHGLLALLTVWIVWAICSKGFWPHRIKFLYFYFHPVRKFIVHSGTELISQSFRTTLARY